MNTTQFLAAVRQASYIGDASAYPEWTDAKLLLEADKRQQQMMLEQVIPSRQGYWLKSTTLTTSQTFGHRLRLPARSAMNGIFSVEVLTSSNQYLPIEPIDPQEAWLFERETATPQPRKYMIEGGDMVLFPAPSQAVTVRVRYYLKPSTLQATQTAGLVTSVSGNVVSINAIPTDATTGGSINSSTLIDCIRPEGWFEPTLISEPCTINVGLLNVTFTNDVTGKIRVGDMIRAQNQTDWPMLPDSFHGMLADITAIRVLQEIGLADKAAELAGSTGKDLERFSNLLTPRVQTQPMRHKIHSFGTYRNRR